MRPTILSLIAALSLVSLGSWPGAQAFAAEAPKDITRVAIAVSGGPVAYTDQFRQDPPAIVIEFRAHNVRAQLEPVVIVNSGIMKEIRSEYYPPGRRALKSLTLTLVQPAAYTVAQQANQIVIDIETPPGLLSRHMAIDGGLTILGIEARETLISRLQAMGDALQQVAPPATAESVKPKPVVVTKQVQIPQLVVQPAPASIPVPVSRKGLGGFWPGLLIGIGATCIGVAGWSHHLSAARRADLPTSSEGRRQGGGRWAAFGSLRQVVGWRRRRKAVLIRETPAVTPVEFLPIAQGASVFEQLALKAMQRQDQKLVSSKAIAGLGTLWVVQKDEQRQGLLCLVDGGFFERKVLEQFYEALQQEALRSGSVLALGAFTAPAQSFAKEKEITLIPREEVIKLMEVELKSAALVLDEEMLKQQLVKPQGDLAQAQAKIQTLEQQVAELKAAVATKEVEAAQKEQLIRDLTSISNQLTQEADQLKAKSAEADQRLAAEQEKKTQLETQIAQLEAQLKVQASTVAEKEQLIQELTEAAKDTIKAVVAEEPKATQEVLQGQERRRWPRLDLSSRTTKGVLIRATSEDGGPINGEAKNIGGGGLCVELPVGERLADEFELKLFLPDRTKPIEAIGKLVWKGLPAASRDAAQAGLGSRRRMEQLGIALSAINAPDQEAISRFVEERKPELVSIG